VARRRPLHQQRDNDLGRLDSSSDGLRANATAKRPSLTSPHEGREPAIKAKEPEVRSAGGADGLVGGGNCFGRGSLTYGDHHLSTGERRLSQCAPAGPHSRPHHRNEDGTVPEHERRPRGVRRVVRPPVQPVAQGGPRHRQPACGATDARAADEQPHSAPVVGGGTGSSARAAQAGEPDTRQLPAPRTANALLPRSLREGEGRCPRGGGPRLGAPSSPVRMMNILEAEGKGEATARLALPHHEAYCHHPR
jgi:hypothetical protein